MTEAIISQKQHPWEDGEVSPYAKLLSFTVLAFSPFIIFIALPSSVYINNSSLAPIIIGVIWFLLLIFLWRRYLRHPSRFMPQQAAVPVDKMGETFEVKFNGLLGRRTFSDTGSIRFLDNALIIDGKLPPGPMIILGIFLFTGVLPALLFGFGLGFIPAIILANIFASEEKIVHLPYNQIEVKSRGKTISVKADQEVPNRFKFRLGTNDGERFYREMEVHLSRKS